jgi:hypothetical protein
MTPQPNEELVQALEQLAIWGQKRGFACSPPKRPAPGGPVRLANRQLTIAGQRFAYRIRINLEPPGLWLTAFKDEHSAGFALGFWGLVDHEAWLGVRQKIVAADSGSPLSFP